MRINDTTVANRRILGPSYHDELRRAAERAVRYGLSARRTPGIAEHEWLVESRSDPALLHITTVDQVSSNVLASCDCIGWNSYRLCQHVAATCQAAKLGPWHEPDTDVVLTVMQHDLQQAHGQLAYALRFGEKPSVVASCRRDIERIEAGILRERAQRTAVTS